jgi:hypothetical protein
MSIEMVAALRVPFDEVPASARARALIDGVLAYVGRFGASEEQLALSMRMVVGDALDAHDDPRGVLIFPVVDELPRHPTYDGVIAEIGASGLWIRPPEAREAASLAEAILGDGTDGAEMLRDARKVLFDAPVRPITHSEVELEIQALEARARRILSGQDDD